MIATFGNTDQWTMIAQANIIGCCTIARRFSQGLLLSAFGDAGDITRLRSGGADGRTVDAFIVDG
jgi:hypothetical protein